MIERIIDRRGVATDYYKEAGSATVASVHTSLGGGKEQWQYFRTPWALSGAPVSTQGIPDSVGEAYLRVTDGRGNVTKIWADRFGAPTKIVNAAGNTTLIERGDPRWAAVATKVVQPNGYTTSAQYDDHGNIAAIYATNPLDDGRNAVTRYHWDHKWDFVDSIVTPSGLATTMAYDATNGNRRWQQTGPDSARRVNFTYYASGSAAGLLRSVILQGAPPDTVFYDQLGNPSSYKTPRGFLTQYFNDAIGRTYETRQQVDVSGTTRMLKVATTYDVMARDTMTVTSGLSTGDPVAGVRRTLDAAGDDSLVTRWTAPDSAELGNLVTRIFRDALGRVVKQIAPDGAADSTLYDAAGNIAVTFNRNGDSVVYDYDNVNRLRRRSTSAVHFGTEIIGLARGQVASPDPVEAVMPGEGLSQSYPWGRPGGYDIPAVIDTFVYSPTDGTLTDANNAVASVHYTYFRGGLLHTEQNSIAQWASCTPPNCPAPHVYTITKKYDPDGRLWLLTYPSAITRAGSSTVQYTYSPYGDLGTVTDFDTRVTLFTVNKRSQLQQRTFPGGSSERFTYDNDGNLASDTLYDPNDPGGTYPRTASFSYDARGKRLGMSGTLFGHNIADSYAFDVLGQMVSSSNTTPLATSTTTYMLDGVGNVWKRAGAEASLSWVNGGRVQESSSNNGFEWSYYIPGTGRLSFTKNVASMDTVGDSLGGGGRPAMMNHYDAAGNLIWTGSAILRLNDYNGGAAAQTERRLYYGPDGKLRAVETRALYISVSAPSDDAEPGGFARSFEEYRYDALGRRVVTRTEQKCDTLDEYNGTNAPCHVSGVRRTIWDRSRELGEIQVPLEAAENDTYAGQGTITAESINLAPFYGAVAYIYDGRVDQPLGITRLRYSNLDSSNTIVTLPPFTYYPNWDIHGVVSLNEGAGSPPAPACAPGVGGAKVTCISWIQDLQWLPYRDASTVWRDAWHGSLLEDKVGAGGLMYRRNRYYDSKSGRFTQEDPIGLAGGMNLYGFAAGDLVNYSDPFGLCPPHDTNVADCGNDNLGNAWRALDGAGKAGRAVISGVVDDGLNVVAGSAQGACGSKHSCFDPGSGTITVEVADPSGAMAVELAHEYGHSTETQAKNTTEYGKNELRAWDESRKVYNKLNGTYRKEAVSVFGAAFNALRPGTTSRQQQLQIWIQNALKRFGPP